MLWLEFAVGIAAQHDRVGLDVPVRRFDFRPCAVFDIGDDRLFKDLDAEACRGACLTDTQVQRVQVPIAIAYKCAVIRIGTELVARLLAVPDFVCFGRVVALAGRCEVVYPLELFRLYRDLGEAVLEIAVDIVLCDTFTNDVIAAPLHVPDEIGDAVPVLLLDLVETTTAMNELTAVASRGTPADPISFDQRHGVAALSERQRCRNARKAPADDADIRRLGTLEDRVVSDLGDRSRVVGPRMFLPLMNLLHTDLYVS